MKEDYRKSLKMLTAFVRENPTPYNGQVYEKQMGSKAMYQLIFRLQNKFRKIPLLKMC